MRSVSRLRRAPRTVLPVPAAAASSNARFVIDLDPGTGTVARTGPGAVGAGQGVRVDVVMSAILPHPCHHVRMCGRYASTRDPATLAAEFDAVDAAGDEAASHCDFNVAPTKPVLAVVTRHPRDEEGTPDPDRTERSIRVMRWGLVPHWAKDPSVGSRLINARAESAADKPAFRTSVARHRCLLPADGWFEWQRDGTRKQPYFITPRNGAGVALAGLWATWRSRDAEPGEPPLVTCAVITTDAVGPFTAIHARMPLVLHPDAWTAWLDPDSEDPGELLRRSPDWLADGIELRPVSPAVNKVRNNGPELIERVDLEPEQPALLDLDQVR